MPFLAPAYPPVAGVSFKGQTKSPKLSRDQSKLYAIPAGSMVGFSLAGFQVYPHFPVNGSLLRAAKWVLSGRAAQKAKWTSVPFIGTHYKTSLVSDFWVAQLGLAG